MREYARGVVGGLIFSLPLLYTMEVWWAGFSLGSGRILLILSLTCLLLLAYNTYAGVRPEETWAGVAIDTVEELGLALVMSASFLYLLGRIVPGDSLREVMGKTVIEALLIAIGISIGTAQVSQEDDQEPSVGKRPRDLLGIVSLSACGAVVLATNIAVTDEVVMLARESSQAQLIAMMLVSLLLSGLMLTFSELLKGRHSPLSPILRNNMAGAALVYSIALVISYVILFLFGRFEALAWPSKIAMTVVLAVPSCIGAAAGKLVIR